MRLIRGLHKLLPGLAKRKLGYAMPHPIVWSFWLPAAELPGVRHSLAACKSVDTIRCTPDTEHGATRIHVKVVLQPDRLATQNPMCSVRLAEFQRGENGWNLAMMRELLRGWA